MILWLTEYGLLSHLKHSFLIASTYFSFGRSANVGRAFLPIMSYISSWALLCTSGLRTIARINVNRADTVFQELSISLVGALRYWLTVSAPPVRKDHSNNKHFNNDIIITH